MRALAFPRTRRRADEAVPSRLYASIAALAIDLVLQRFAARERDRPGRTDDRRRPWAKCRRQHAASTSPSDASRAGFPAAAAPAGTRRASRQRASLRRAPRRYRRRPGPCRGAALTRNAPPAAPSRLSLRNSGRSRRPLGLGRQRQQAHQDFGARQKGVELRRSMEAFDPGHRLRGPAPAGDPEAEPRQDLRGLAADHAHAHDADRDLVRRTDACAPSRCAGAAAPRRRAHGCETPAHAARRRPTTRRVRSGCAARASGNIAAASDRRAAHRRRRRCSRIAFRFGRLASRPRGGRQTHRIADVGLVADRIGPQAQVAARGALLQERYPAFGLGAVDRDQNGVGGHRARNAALLRHGFAGHGLERERGGEQRAGVVGSSDS